MGSSATLPSEGSLLLRAPLDSNSSASLWLSADGSWPPELTFGGRAWLTKRQTRRPHCVACGHEAARLRAGPCGLPTAPTAGHPPERGLLSAVIGAVYIYFIISLSLVEFPLMFLASFPVPTSIPCARWSCGLSQLRPQSWASESSLGPAVPQAPESYPFQLFLTA